RTLLGLLERTALRIDLVIHFADARAHELLGRASRRARSQNDDRDGHQHFPEHDESSYRDGRNCPAIYPLRVRTTRSFLLARTTSGCQPGVPLDSNAIRY